MSTLRSYLSAILLITCTLIAIPNQAMDARNLLRHALLSLPSIQNISNFAVQAKNTAIENYYIVTPALVVTVIGSYSYLRKRFFGRKTVAIKPIKKQKPISQKISVKPVKATEPEKITEQIKETEQAKSTKPVRETKPVKVTAPVKATEQKQVAPVVQPIDNSQAHKIIKVVNSHDQSLKFSVSNDNDDLIQQFSVPSHKKSIIKIK